MLYLIDRSATIAENKDIYWVELKSHVFFIAGHANEHEGTNNGATAAGKADTTFYKYPAFFYSTWLRISLCLSSFQK